MAVALTLPNVAGYAFDVSPDLSKPATRARLSRPALKGFLRIMEKWGIRDVDARHLLGGISSGSYYNLKRDSAHRALDQDTLTRISLLIGIFKALNILYTPALADRWVCLANRNPMFQGISPLAYMLQRGLPGMMAVRQLLDARRGGQ